MQILTMSLVLAGLMMTTACHKTFMNDDGSYVNTVPKLETPTIPVGEKALEKQKAEAGTLTVDCVYDTSSNVKLQIVLDSKKKSVAGIAVYDTNKGETPEKTYSPATKQSTENKVQSVDFENGSSLSMTTALFKKSQQADVLINDKDAYSCN
jgi:hypothetical protein